MFSNTKLFILNSLTCAPMTFNVQAILRSTLMICEHIE